MQNSSVEIEGVKIWGSPVTPYFLGMAFNAKSGKEIKKVWNKIPLDTDIIITHGPPKAILDNGIGCEELQVRVNKIKPLIHCFGHAHGKNGILKDQDITFINASVVNSPDPLKSDQYKLVAKEIIISFIKN